MYRENMDHFTLHTCVTKPCSKGNCVDLVLPGDAIKCDPERENCAVLTIAAQTANSIHIRVTFIVVTRYHYSGRH